MLDSIPTSYIPPQKASPKQLNRSGTDAPISLEEPVALASSANISRQHYILDAPVDQDLDHFSTSGFTLRKAWLFFAASVFLVSVPVFFQAPLVRFAPGVSLGLTLGWFMLSWRLMAKESTRLWGDLLLGFTGSWLAGSIYWGWLRWEPLFHIPVEAICLPIALWAMFRGKRLIGSLFYVGSLMGTAVTDFYFYMVDLIPHWRQLMRVDPEFAIAIYQDAVTMVETSWGVSWIVILLGGLLIIGLLPMVSRNLGWWAFSGAVLGTLLVDGLFWIAANSI